MVKVIVTFQFMSSGRNPVVGGYIGALRVTEGGPQNWDNGVRLPFVELTGGYYRRDSWPSYGVYEIYAQANGRPNSALFRDTIRITEESDTIIDSIEDYEGSSVIYADTIYVNVINEETLNAGVTIEGILLKDNNIALSGTVDGVDISNDIVLRDGSKTLTGDWDIGNGRKIWLDGIRARDGDGLELYDDGGSGIFVADGGNVGIGTATPGAKLQINDNIHYIFMYENDGTVDKRMYSLSSIDDNLQINARDDLANYVRNIITFEHDGNVGIGVTDPDTTLEVYKVGTQLKLSGGALDYATFAVAADGALTITTVDDTAAEGDITLFPDGNVGINVSDPTDALEVYKVGTQLRLSGGVADYATFAVAADGALTIATVDFDAAEGDICLMPDGNVGVGIANPTTALNIGDAGILQVNSAGDDKNIQVYHDDTNSIIKTSSGALYLQPGNNAIYGYDGVANYILGMCAAGVTKVYLNSNGFSYFTGGNVGIGITTPDTLLELSKEAADAELTISAYHDTEATTPKLTMRKADDAEATPALVDDNAVLGTISFQGHDGSGWHEGARIEARIDGAPSDGTDMPTELTFWTTPDGSGSPTQRMEINPDGRVGMGTDATGQVSLTLGNLATNYKAIRVESDAAGVNGRVMPLEVVKDGVGWLWEYGDSAGNPEYYSLWHWNGGANYEEYLRMDFAGTRVLIPTADVGINVAAPAEKLSVGGNIAVTGTVDGVDIAARDHARSHDHSNVLDDNTIAPLSIITPTFQSSAANDRIEILDAVTRIEILHDYGAGAVTALQIDDGVAATGQPGMYAGNANAGGLVWLGIGGAPGAFTEEGVYTYRGINISNLGGTTPYACDMLAAAGDVSYFLGGTEAQILTILSRVDDKGIFEARDVLNNIIFSSGGGVNDTTWSRHGYECNLGVDIDEFSIDGTLAGNSDSAIPTEKAVKAYADALSYDINDINDITIAAPADNEVLAYDNGTATWINQTAAEAGLVYTHPNHTGEVTSLGDGAQTIAVNVVDNTNLSNMAQDTIKGRITAGAGDPEDLTAANVRTIINVENGANAYSHPNHTGDVTSVGDGATTIGANKVDNTMLANMAQNTIKGRIAGGAGDPEDLTAANVRTIINVENGSTADQTKADIDGLGLSHDSLVDVSANDHHAQSHNTASHSDITIAAVGDNDILAYDNGTATWINQTAAEAGLAVSGHNHTLASLTTKAHSELTGVTADLHHAQSHSIDSHSNVTIAAVGDNEVLAYDNGTATWINQTAAEAGLSVSGHNHTLAGLTSQAHNELSDAPANAHHAQAHTAASHSDIASTGADIDDAVNKKHTAAHTVVSHSDTTATGAELNELTGGGDTVLHDHDGIAENTAARHTQAHTAASHTDIASTGADIDDAVNKKHNAAHNIASHSDTTATGAELETLTDGSDVGALHKHGTVNSTFTVVTDVRAFEFVPTQYRAEKKTRSLTVTNGIVTTIGAESGWTASGDTWITA